MERQEINRQTEKDRQTDRKMDRQRDGQTDREMDRQTDRDGQTNTLYPEESKTTVFGERMGEGED